MGSSTAPRSLSFGLLLTVAALGASLLVGLLAARHLAASREYALGMAETQSRNLAQAMDQTISATLAQVDHSLRSLVLELERDLADGTLDRQQIQRTLDVEQSLLPEVLALRVTDAEGLILFNNPTDDPRASAADRPYFQPLRDDPRAGLVITRPFLGKFTKRWIITCARRYGHPDGRFAGVVVAPVPVEHFRRALAGFDPGPGGMLTLRDADAGFITRHPEFVGGVALSLGDRSASPEFQRLFGSGLTQATYRGTSPTDGVRRTLTYRRMKGAPLMVAAGLAEDNYLAQWRRDRTITLALLGAFLLGLWGAAALLWRAWTARARDAQALRETSELLSLFISHSPIYAYIKEVTATESRVLHASENFQQMVGIPGSAMAGRTMTELFPSPMAEKIIADDIAVVSSGQLLELPETFADRTYRTLKFPIRQGGRTLLAGFTIDVTEARRAEEERLQLQSLVQQSQKLESLGSLAGGVAHDMNNVLGAILGLATATETTLPEGHPARAAFGTIVKAAERGGRMVKSLLSFARQAPAELRELDLNLLLQEEAHLLERTTLARVQLALDLAPDLRPVRGDASALAHAVMNLCVNAVDAMPEGGTLTLRSRNAGADQVELVVEDTGSGMSREVLERALDPFFTTKAEGKGTGLGLSMVYATAKAHGGRLDLQSEPGRGTLVRVLLPASGPSAELPPEAPADAPGPRGLSVLLVDDDELIQDSMAALLEALGHRTTVAASGEEALAHLAGGLNPDLVLLDVNMPGMGGAAALPRLRELAPGVPVLLATGRADQAALDLVQAHPGVSLLAKPFSMTELRKRLAALPAPLSSR